MKHVERIERRARHDAKRRGRGALTFLVDFLRPRPPAHLFPDTTATPTSFPSLPASARQFEVDDALLLDV